ncbi:MAG: hypothetical protein BGO29_13310 [Bacteroidales bacterium 36-12]|jgi:hypothetical protein|nr:MAG: hypothetical protein BGO29_13310 [Bacteroidales bacterium 36-12]
MNKLICIFAVAIGIVFTACEKNDVIIDKDKTEFNTEQQKMRSALETTTNILLNMITSDETYFDELNKVIVAGSSNYMEDRVMLKDLFSTTSKSSALRVKVNSNKFTSDFKTAFTKNRPQKIGGINGINSNTFSNPDSLIQFLIENNVILNCPYPLEDYDEDNRIPAISFDPMNNDSTNVGYLLDKLGNISEVIVSQSYADKHPVWILIPYQPENTTQSAANVRHAQRSKTATNDGFRATFHKIYLTEYYCTIFKATLDMRILRSSNSFSWNDQTKNYTGSFSQMSTFQMPRKYVGYAKDQKMSGWYPIDIEWDYDWHSDKVEQGLSVYEYDPGTTYETSITVKAKIDGVEVGASVNAKFSKYDDIIALQPLGRSYFYDIAKNGIRKDDWKWTEVTKRNFWGTPTQTKVHNQIDGKYIYRFSPSFMMSVSAQ